MSASFTALQRDRLKLLLRVTAVSAGVGAVYGALLRTGATIAVGILTGVLNGILIAAAVGAIEIFLLRENTSMKRLVRLPFVAVIRRAIVFHGDVMNTAARLEQATRDLGVRFIASADALSALGPQPDMALKDLGALTLRGRREPIRAWGVESH